MPARLLHEARQIGHPHIPGVWRVVGGRQVGAERVVHWVGSAERELDPRRSRRLGPERRECLRLGLQRAQYAWQ